MGTKPSRAELEEIFRTDDESGSSAPVSRIPAGGTKYDSGKPRMDLLVPEAEELTAQVFSFGAEKYGDYNWAKGINYSRLHGALRRHLAAWARGIDADEESGLSHLGHASCCLQMLIWMQIHRKDLDDRPHTQLVKETING